MPRLLEFPRRASRRGAFTLVEVILAIAIATGLLMVALFFYRQAAELRVRLIEEAERVGAIRLVMDRLTMDLRCARRTSGPQLAFSGSSDALRFVTSDLQPRAAWATSQSAGGAPVHTGLKWVSYGLNSVAEGTNVSVAGLMRTERPCFETLSGNEAKRSVPAEMEASRATNAAPKTEAQPVSDSIRYLRFRYWDGANWLESWSGPDLPLGVEVTMANEPPEPPAASGAGADREKQISSASSPKAEENPQNLYRRVISVPGGTAAKGADGSTRPASKANSSWEDWP